MKPKNLKPIALGLPTLLAMYSYGFTTYTKDENTSPDYTASGSPTTGFTSATYSGTAATIFRINQAYDPTHTPNWVVTLQDFVNNATTTQASATWNVNTYTKAESNVNNSGNSDRNGGWIWTTHGQCGGNPPNCSDADAFLQ